MFFVISKAFFRYHSQACELTEVFLDDFDEPSRILRAIRSD